MKILMLHNYYQIRGGEDVSAEAEVELLSEAGHDLTFLARSNNYVNNRNTLQTAIDCIWSRNAYSEILFKLRAEKFDVMHVHNFFPLWSPSVHAAAYNAGVPSVQTLHNYRLSCLNGLFFTQGASCKRCCSSRWFLPGIVRRCYRKSLSGSLIVASMLMVHRSRHTWNKNVAAFVCPSMFVKEHFMSAGISSERLHIVPHFVKPQCLPKPLNNRHGIIYVGRLSEEKGVRSLLQAWAKVQKKEEMTLKIVGDGPMLGEIIRRAQSDESIIITGQLNSEEVHEEIASSLALILPSECFETFGLTIAEAFSLGTPVIASDIGALGELIKKSNGGWLFKPGDTIGLAKQINLLSLSHENWIISSKNANLFFKNNLSDKQHLKDLLSIYNSTL